MTHGDYMALLPLLVTGYGGVVLMTVVAFWRSHAAAFYLSLLIFAAGLGSVFVALPYAPRAVTPLVQVDAFSLFFAGLILAGALLVAMLSRDYLQTHEKNASAYYVLLVFAVLGTVAIAMSRHFASFFLGLETLSVSLYGLVGYTRRHRPSLEAAMKYLVLAASSSAFLLFGIALIYADFGTMDFRVLGPRLAGGMPVASAFGLALVLVGFGFKLAVAPFHMWSPDVYQGAPAPVTALIATGSKSAVLALLLRLVAVSGLATDRTAFTAVSVLAIATMLVGNLLALLQNNVKRILAYSSIAHVGYLLIPVLAANDLAAPSVAFYLVSYFATTIAAFGVVSVLSRTREFGDVEELADYRGLGLRHPVLAAIFALALLSLTGIPLTAGFIAKFYIFAAAIQAGLWALVIFGVVGSGISAYYYLRVLATLYARPETEPQDLPTATLSTGICLAVAAATIVFFGVYPAPLIRLAEAATRAMGF